MKKILAILTVIFCFGVTAAFAVDGGALYKKRCAKCHRDGSESSKSGGGVVLKGQSSGEIEMKMNGYADGSYGGKKKKTMIRIASKLKGQEINAIAEYIGSM
ncbi:cytochrome c-553 [Pseudodesulfovibrio nedwellii]|uniref:Cytochrome c-553 n=1 Tax=Pseudodesulfovibrio nedwellii TaxID=2973072 RepID=A0ABM8B4B2_9BACT|nr:MULTISPECIES: c-type cytochrome [Pseudodesulfovibrio]BDQ38655.1 cytochrome c-553 [Pseudodesulfovibrio nedwellii]